MANIVLLCIGIAWRGWMGVAAILLTSFFMAPMFRTIFALGIRDLGPLTKEGFSLIVMAIIGGAVCTPLMGLVFDATKSMALGMLVPLRCYVVVTGYAFLGSQLAPRRQSLSLTTSRVGAA